MQSKVPSPISIERLDQGHLYPLGERRDKHVTGGARISALLHRRRTLYLDSLSRQLISWLFGTSTWPEAGVAFGPLHGRPSACGIVLHMDLNWDVGRIALASAVNLNHLQVSVSNHVGGHHYRIQIHNPDKCKVKFPPQYL
jgi:hypothetical protein